MSQIQVMIFWYGSPDPGSLSLELAGHSFLRTRLIDALASVSSRGISYLRYQAQDIQDALKIIEWVSHVLRTNHDVCADYRINGKFATQVLTELITSIQNAADALKSTRNQRIRRDQKSLGDPELGKIRHILKHAVGSAIS
ncbi:MAG: hypothetical protein HY422_03450 [Candidatus Komeilibacteria bacterium]|nr:hypothetical protein [Candidatus Komeilibacteria bacterium]